MCKINCSGGCKDCDPESHTIWIVQQFDLIRAAFSQHDQAVKYVERIREPGIVYTITGILVDKEL